MAYAKQGWETQYRTNASLLLEIKLMLVICAKCLVRHLIKRISTNCLIRDFVLPACPALAPVLQRP